MANTEQSFYIAVIIYESSSDIPDYQPLYEECFVLIRAISLEEAKKKALSHAQKQEGSYQNPYEQTITWFIKQIVDVNNVLYDIGEDVTELYARHFRNYEAYCSFEPLLSKEEL